MAAFNPTILSLKAAGNVVLALMFCCTLSACNWGKSSDSDRVNVTGVLTGTVVDSPVGLPGDATSQSYPGAVVTVSTAIEVGTYRTSAESPVLISYEQGEEVVELVAGADGAWEVELPQGMYFVRAFFGAQSYSEEMLTEVVEGEVIQVTLELIHGV